MNTKVKRFALLLAVLALTGMLTLGAFAAEEKTSGDFTYVVQNDNTVKITGYNGNAKDVVIPSKIDGKTVTVIAGTAFDSCGRVQSVSIPKEITTIENGAFYGSRIMAINVAQDNENYSSDANGVLFNKNKTELIKYSSGNERTEYAIPDTVTTISKYAFLSSPYLKNITIPESLTKIGSYTFESCGIETLIIPGTVKTISECAFAECSLLTSLYIEKGVEEIDHNAFLYCEKLNVYFSGTKAEWEEINVAYSNVFNVHFNASYPFDHAPAYNEKLPDGAKCGERITITYTCTCGDTYTKAGYAPDHTGGKSTCVQKAICSRCGETYGDFSDHDYEIKTTKATLEKDGRNTVSCKNCSAGENAGIISRPKSFVLSSTKYTYNGKEKKPSVTVKDAKGNTISKSYYTVKYESGRKLPGKYTVTITFKGDYEGTKKLYFTIAPKAVEKLTATATKASVTLKWSKVAGADGYRVYKYNSSTKKYESVKNVTATSVKLTGLKSGTTYKFRVRAYKKDGDTIYGEYSSVKQVTTKLSAPSKVTSKGGTTSVKLTWSKSRGADGYRIYYKSGDSWKTLVKSVKGTTYTLKDLPKAKKRTYAVRAYKKTNDGTMWSDYKQFSAATKPGKTTLTVKSGSPGAATLAWKEVKGANTYRVYYKVNKGDYKLYKTYSKPTKVTLKKLKGGDTYTFKVQAGIKVTGGTVWGDAVTKSVKITYRAPRYLKAMKSGNYLITTVFGGVETTTAIKGNNLYVKTDDYYSDEADMTLIYIGAEEKWYYIYEAYGVYTVVYDYQLPEKETGTAAIESVKSMEIPTKYKSAKDRIDGKTVFRETANYDGYSESYYFDGTTLVRIDLDYGSTIVNQSVTEFTTSVPDKLFKLPAGYQYVEAEI